MSKFSTFFVIPAKCVMSFFYTLFCFTANGYGESDEDTLFDAAYSGEYEIEGGESRNRHKRIHENEVEMEEKIQVRSPTKRRNQDKTYTVEDAVESIGMGWFQLKIYLVCGVITVINILLIVFPYYFSFVFLIILFFITLCFILLICYVFFWVNTVLFFSCCLPFFFSLFSLL